MKWEDIYTAAIDCGCGEPNLKRKDQARWEVIEFIDRYFGIDLEAECDAGVIECIEDYIEYFTTNYYITFDNAGNLSTSKTVTLQDKVKEFLNFYKDFLDDTEKMMSKWPVVQRLLQDVIELN